MWFGGGGREDDDAAWSQVAPALALAVTCLLVLGGKEGDDSDFYHREMNSDCSPAFPALGDGECQYKHNGIFRAATPPLIHSLEWTNSRDHSPRRVLIGPPCRLPPPMKKTHQTLLSLYRSLEIRLLTVSSLCWPRSVRRYGEKEEQERGRKAGGKRR